MTDDANNTSKSGDPILSRSDAPEHAPDFWTKLESSMGSTRPDETTEMAAVTSLPPQGAERGRDSSWVRWPLLAAAALVAVLGLGALVLRGDNEATVNTEVADTSDVVDEAALLDGPEGGDATLEDPDSVELEPNAGDAGGVTASGATEGDTRESVPVATGIPLVGAETYEPAAGAEGGTVFVPLDRGLPSDATFLGTWDSRAVSWFGVTDPSLTCTDPNYSEIRLVNGSGITQSVRDPQPRFSGELSLFTVQPSRDLAAWLVSCGTQLELYVASLATTGHIEQLDLVWFGQGSNGSLISWADDSVSFSALAVDGSLFFVDFNTTTRALSGTGLKTPAVVEDGAPRNRSMLPLAVSADGRLSYWNGAPEDGASGGCDGEPNDLWLRWGDAQWVPALAVDTVVRDVTAVALEPEFSQVAFADSCGAGEGRVFIGTQRADGLLSDFREVDLLPFVPGFADRLQWIDATTLRIETNNESFGLGTVRFDFVFNEGRNQGILRQID